jgi:hypothetical protein
LQKEKHITIIIIIIVTKKYLNKILLQASSVWLDAHPLGSGHLALGLMA